MQPTWTAWSGTTTRPSCVTGATLARQGCWRAWRINGGRLILCCSWRWLLSFLCIWLLVVRLKMRKQRSCLTNTSRAVKAKAMSELLLLLLLGFVLVYDVCLIQTRIFELMNILKEVEFWGLVYLLIGVEIWGKGHDFRKGHRKLMLTFEKWWQYYWEAHAPRGETCCF